MSLNETNYLSGPRNVITNQLINKLSTISKSGNNIPSVPVSIGVPLIRCTEDGGIYRQNRVYVLKADESGYDSVFPPHTHDPLDPFNEGGSYYDIRTRNSPHLLEFNDESFRVENFHAETVGTATAKTERLNGSIYGLLITGTLEADVVNLMKGGLRLAFSDPFELTFKAAISHNTALVFRGGVNGDPVENVAGIQSQVLAEGCTSASENYQIVTANGSFRTGLALPTSNLLQASPMGYKIEYFPGDKVIFTDGNGNTVIKSDNLPTMSMASDGDATLRYGISTSNATQKAVKMWASLLLGKVYDTITGINAWL